MRLPDWRDRPGTHGGDRGCRAAASRGLEAPVATTLDRSSCAWAERFARDAASGMPDTLVHGVYHPGNVRGTPVPAQLLDWGDSGIGQPLLDLRRSSPPTRAVPSLRSRIAGSTMAERLRPDPMLKRPHAGARRWPPRKVAIYQRFVDAIEPVERRHHDADARSSSSAAPRSWG